MKLSMQSSKSGKGSSSKGSKCMSFNPSTCTSLPGLLCFASFCLGYFKHRRQAAMYLNLTLPFLLVQSTPTHHPMTKPFHQLPSTLCACDVCLVLVGLVACGEQELIFKQYKFVRSVTGVVHHNNCQDNPVFRRRVDKN